MKRIFCLFLCVLLLLSLPACAASDAETVHRQYKNAIDLYTAGYTASIDFSLTVNNQSASGKFLVMTEGDNCAVTREGSTDARYFVKGIAYRKGYFLGETYFGDTEEEPAKIKESSTKEVFTRECTRFFCINPFASSLPTVTEEMLEDAEFTSEGSRIAFEVEIGADAVKTYLADDTLTVNEGLLMASFDQLGDMVSLSLRFNVTTSNGLQNIFSITYSFLNRGAVPAILPPENAADYTEM